MNDFIYLYDGSFLSLLNVIYSLIKKKIIPLQIVSNNNYVKDLFSKEFTITTSKSNTFYFYLNKKLGSNFTKWLYDIFLTEDKEMEMIIYNLIINGLKYGTKIYYLRNLECVDKGLKLSNAIHREAHKMKGFLRFREIDNNFLIAKMAPTYNIISYLAKYFKRRMPKGNWFIIDEKRELIYVYYNGLSTLLKKKNIKELSLVLSKKEKEYEKLWQGFFKTVAIKDRTNKRCQRNFMPKKYWKYIIEMENEK